MPGLTAPSDYAEEPPRHPALKINSKVSATLRSPLPATHSPWRIESDWVGALLPCGVANRADSFAALAWRGPVQAGWIRARASTAPARWPIRPPPTRRWCCAAAGSAPLPVCVRRARAVTAQ